LERRIWKSPDLIAVSQNAPVLVPGSLTGSKRWSERVSWVKARPYSCAPGHFGSMTAEYPSTGEDDEKGTGQSAAAL
jgi:hypothetical protein